MASTIVKTTHSTTLRLDDTELHYLHRLLQNIPLLEEKKEETKIRAAIWGAADYAIKRIKCM